MNSALPPGDRGHRRPTARGASGRGWSVPGAGGLVGRVATIAGQPRNGRRCATFGPPWLVPWRLGVTAKAANTRARTRQAWRPEAEKPAAAEAGRARGRGAALRIDAVATLALLGLEGFDGITRF